jgi:hypothetical protein
MYVGMVRGEKERGPWIGDETMDRRYCSWGGGGIDSVRCGGRERKK